MTYVEERVLQEQLSWLKGEALRYHAAWLRATGAAARCEELVKLVDDQLLEIKHRVEAEV